MATRLLFDLGGTVSSGGTATVGGGAGQQQPASSWSLAIITASLASGSGSWTIELVRSQGATGTLLGATFGDTVQSGPYLLAPGEMLQASVAGANPTVGIVGSVYGTQNLDPSNLPPISAVPSQAEAVNATIGGPVPVENYLTTQLQVTQSPTFSATYTAAPGDSDIQTVPVPQGAVSVGMVAWSTGGLNDQILQCEINSSLITDFHYFQQGGEDVVPQIFYGGDLLDVPGGTIQLQLSADAGNSGNVSYAAVFFPAGFQVLALNTPSEPLSVAQVPSKWSKTATFTAGATPTLTQLAQAAGSLVVTYWLVQVHNSGTTSYTATMTVSGSVQGTIFNDAMSVLGSAGAGDRTTNPPDLNLQMGSTESVTIALAVALPTGYSASISMGGYEN